MKILATNKLNIIRTLTILIIGLVTLSSCNQNTGTNTMHENSGMMHNNGDYYYWGMHMGWWFLIVLIVIILMVLFFNSTRRK
ncbi:MAG: hypothetical protein JJE55_12385 [Flavobacteriaceae bacterium]|nr:hypothetical protein [Flavobacteriaceae bacterium]